ncbi:hypothetical protein Hesp01_27810 [Herbidospora sp. NBRC 101105]|nr:hypothetical protein Hesp01_27810 [Herbidospora sp. NBRC 101105]
MQAAAANEQVDVARDQLMAAQDAMADHIAEVSALTSYRDYFESHSAKIAVALESTPFPPTWKRFRYGDEQEEDLSYPRLNKGESIMIFDETVNRHDDIYFMVRGLIINVGQTPAHIFGGDFSLTSGKSPLSDSDIPIPQHLSSRGEYLLLPGQQAIFEWKAERYFEQWTDIYMNSHRGEFTGLGPDWKPFAERPVCHITAWPAGSVMELHTVIEIKIDENVVRPYRPGGASHDGKWAMRQTGHASANVYVTYKLPGLPRNLDSLRRTLKGVDIWTNQVRD